MRFCRSCRALVVVLLCPVLFMASRAEACTGIRIKPKDGSVIYGRTMEFAADLKSNVIVIPRGKSYVGTAPGNQLGLHWHAHYAAVGANGFGMPQIVDGLNEAGLAVGLFYFPSYAKYQTVEPNQVDVALAPWELGTFLLGTCADVSQATAAARRVRVGDTVQEQFGTAPPCHFVVHDAAGHCAVLEYVNGDLTVHANPLGVITNSPTFDWHLTNLRNYINLSVVNVPPVALTNYSLESLGQGTGMLGLPGDFTPPSRFVRAVAFTQRAVPVETADQGILQAFHILNQFDIPKGVARSIDDGKEIIDYTLWTAACDLANLRYYFRTFDDSRIRMVDLRNLDLDSAEIATYSMGGNEFIDEISQRPEH